LIAGAADPDKNAWLLMSQADNAKERTYFVIFGSLAVMVPDSGTVDP
jgi:hypothetical protein